MATKDQSFPHSEGVGEEALYHMVRQLPEDERSEYLAEACANDAELRARLEKLLQAEALADDLFEREPVGLAEHQHDLAIASGNPTHSIESLTPPTEEAGAMIGRYKLLQQIGQGGFGTVWMAEQLEPVKRRVALKIIKLGMDTREVIARFEAERQALAMMEHPNIARVLDAGATESGRPFFAMELVKGIAIT